MSYLDLISGSPNRDGSDQRDRNPNGTQEEALSSLSSLSSHPDVAACRDRLELVDEPLRSRALELLPQLHRLASRLRRRDVAATAQGMVEDGWPLRVAQAMALADLEQGDSDGPAIGADRILFRCSGCNLIGCSPAEKVEPIVTAHIEKTGHAVETRTGRDEAES